jgi:hypothetical protein
MEQLKTKTNPRKTTGPWFGQTGNCRGSQISKLSPEISCELVPLQSSALDLLFDFYNILGMEERPSIC